MAEIQSQQTEQKSGVKKSKKLSTRIDLTPMVDLGFLLITFFIFTTTMSQAKAMNLTIPADGVGGKSEADKTVQLILTGGDSVLYYYGKDVKGAAYTTFAASGLRAIIQQKQKILGINKDDLLVLIKPATNSCYKNVVDALDEMTINNVTRYMILEDAEKDLLEIK